MTDWKLQLQEKLQRLLDDAKKDLRGKMKQVEAAYRAKDTEIMEIAKLAAKKKMPPLEENEREPHEDQIDLPATSPGMVGSTVTAVTSLGSKLVETEEERRARALRRNMGRAEKDNEQVVQKRDRYTWKSKRAGKYITHFEAMAVPLMQDNAATAASSLQRNLQEYIDILVHLREGIDGNFKNTEDNIDRSQEYEDFRASVDNQFVDALRDGAKLVLVGPVDEKGQSETNSKGAYTWLCRCEEYGPEKIYKIGFDIPSWLKKAAELPEHAVAQGYSEARAATVLRRGEKVLSAMKETVKAVAHEVKAPEDKLREIDLHGQGLSLAFLANLQFRELRLALDDMACDNELEKIVSKTTDLLKFSESVQGMLGSFALSVIVKDPVIEGGRHVDPTAESLASASITQTIHSLGLFLQEVAETARANQSLVTQAIQRQLQQKNASERHALVNSLARFLEAGLVRGSGDHGIVAAVTPNDFVESPTQSVGIINRGASNDHSESTSGSEILRKLALSALAGSGGPSHVGDEDLFHFLAIEYKILALTSSICNTSDGDASAGSKDALTDVLRGFVDRDMIWKKQVSSFLEVTRQQCFALEKSTVFKIASPRGATLAQGDSGTLTEDMHRRTVSVCEGLAEGLKALMLTTNPISRTRGNPNNVGSALAFVLSSFFFSTLKHDIALVTVIRYGLSFRRFLDLSQKMEESNYHMISAVLQLNNVACDRREREEQMMESHTGEDDFMSFANDKDLFSLRRAIDLAEKALNDSSTEVSRILQRESVSLDMRDQCVARLATEECLLEESPSTILEGSPYTIQEHLRAIVSKSPTSEVGHFYMQQANFSGLLEKTMDMVQIIRACNGVIETVGDNIINSNKRLPVSEQGLQELDLDCSHINMLTYKAFFGTDGSTSYKSLVNAEVRKRQQHSLLWKVESRVSRLFNS